MNWHLLILVGVFRKLCYDNLTSAVRKIPRGYRREETARFVAFRSHWRFEAEFCTPAEPHGKGGSKERLGIFAAIIGCRYRKRRTLPEPARRLPAGRIPVHRRPQTVGAGLVIEREHLLPLAPEGFDLAQTNFPTVNGSGCVKALTNTYSVPLPPGVQIRAKAYASIIELWHEGCVAGHERCYGRQQQILDLEHYLDVLYRKPGALAGSKPLEQRRQAGLWPASFDCIWQALIERQGKQSWHRQMIELLKLGPKHGHRQLQEAVESALAGNCFDVAAVCHLLNAEELRHRSCEAMDVGMLDRYGRPLPLMREYDQTARHWRWAMSNQMVQLQEATIKAHRKSLRMPMMAAQFGSMAEQAIREKKSHIADSGAWERRGFFRKSRGPRSWAGK